MKASYHVAASAGISLGFQAATHSWPAALGCFLSGILIDTDHCLDYYLARKKFPYRYKDLLDFGFDATVSKVYVFFHAYEIFFILWLLIFFFDLGRIWIGIAVGLTTHVLFDQLANPIKPLFYFLTFRIKNRFEKTRTVSEEYFQRCHSRRSNTVER